MYSINMFQFYCLNSGHFGRVRIKKDAWLHKWDVFVLKLHLEKHGIILKQEKLDIVAVIGHQDEQVEVNMKKRNEEYENTDELELEEIGGGLRMKRMGNY